MTNKQQLQWAFIEKHYPKYYSCERVGLSNRIASFIDGSLNEDEEDLARHELTVELDFQGGDETLEEFAETYMNKLNDELYQEALKSKGSK